MVGDRRKVVERKEGHSVLEKWLYSLKGLESLGRRTDHNRCTHVMGVSRMINHSDRRLSQMS